MRRTLPETKTYGSVGVATIQRYLRAGLIDELHLAFRPILMGSGENLFAGLDLTSLGYHCTRHDSTPHALHMVLTKQEGSC